MPYLLILDHSIDFLVVNSGKNLLAVVLWQKVGINSNLLAVTDNVV